MGATFEYEMIKDEKLVMPNYEIDEHAQLIFKETRDIYGTEPEPCMLGEFQHTNIRRDLTFPCEDSAVEYVCDYMENNKHTGFAHVVGVLNVGWLVGGWCKNSN